MARHRTGNSEHKHLYQKLRASLVSLTNRTGSRKQNVPDIEAELDCRGRKRWPDWADLHRSPWPLSAEPFSSKHWLSQPLRSVEVKLLTSLTVSRCLKA